MLLLACMSLAQQAAASANYNISLQDLVLFIPTSLWVAQHAVLKASASMHQSPTNMPTVLASTAMHPLLWTNIICWWFNMKNVMLHARCSHRHHMARTARYWAPALRRVVVTNVSAHEAQQLTREGEQYNEV